MLRGITMIDAEYKNVLPERSVIASFESKVEKIFEEIAINSNENHNLIKFRDWLLPMLMNGQVTVS